MAHFRGYEVTHGEMVRYIVLFLRFFLAASFLFTGLDKLIGLGYPNPWMHGFIFGGDPVG